MPTQNWPAHYARSICLNTAPRAMLTGMPPLCFSRSCNGAAGLRARYDCVPSVEGMTWGVVSRGLGVPSETLMRDPATARSVAMPGTDVGGRSA